MRGNAGRAGNEIGPVEEGTFKLNVWVLVAGRSRSDIRPGPADEDFPPSQFVEIDLKPLLPPQELK